MEDLLPVGSRVRSRRNGGFKGVIRRYDRLTANGTRVTVAQVTWDGNPRSIPLEYRDEVAPGTAHGYPMSELEVD